MRQLAAEASLSHVTISKVISGDQGIGRELIEGLARAFGMAEIDIAKRAWGWRGSQAETTDAVTDLSYRDVVDALQGLTVRDRQDVLDYALYKRSRGPVRPDRGGLSTSTTGRALAADDSG